MRTRIACAAVLALSMAGPADLWAGAVQSQPPKPAATESEEAGQSTPGDLGVSLDRVKFALAQAALPRLKIVPDAPTFRVQIVEKRPFSLPSFRESLKIPRQWVPSGGTANYEFMNMVTPPLARPYAAFNSGELAQVVATSLISSLIMYGLKQAAGRVYDQYRDSVEARTREEVRQELEEFLLQHPNAPKPTWWTGTIK
jgi:hypothetical protein